ncbi:MAG: DNA (cytosine-5-)-methyltransferase [Oryzomonas sp.]|uniref:DNA cytosine methyltransferase n=1 Tax=Oryzomonas sp. TaxID=2855186 RepID=UPI00284D9CE1|nr:DNA (cytosine-5-)-methyltransferase [Oryzomonas sp.]MDR3579215.1 DNA (cytosine-5-)-methyltransferase [Oryzomonas sp.]
MRSVELFSGCGGLAMGLSMAGFEHDLMVEWNGDACATITQNKLRGIEYASNWPIRCEDVRKIDWREIDREPHLVAGGPPCQPFSIGGRHTGNEDSRDMWPQAIRAVRDLSPRGFIFENVKGLLRTAFADYLAWIIAHLASPHLEKFDHETYQEHLTRLVGSPDEVVYDVKVLKVNTADYGVAQKRHRVIIMGIRRNLGIPLALPQPTHSRERLLWDQWVTGQYWARHGMPIPTDRRIAATDSSLVQRLRRLTTPPVGSPWVTVRDALLGLGEPNGRNKHIFQAGARVYPGHTGSPLDQPAKALKAGGHGVPGGENMMVCDDGSVRYFTVREAARLQGFPDDFIFPCSWTESMRQLGNAVPVKLALTVGSHMREALNGDEEVEFLNAA